MKNIKYLFVFSIFLLLNVNAKSQDIHFTQFYMSPLNLNPAMTGVSNCTSRLIGNFRNQWAPVLKSNAFNTFSLSYDQKMPVGRYDYFGIGGTLWGDVAGTHRFGTMMGKVSFSYLRKMGGYRQKSHFLVIGAEGGLARRGLNVDKLDYFQNGVETINNPNFFFGDLSAGILWYTILDKYSNFYIGAAFHHLNQANQAFKRTINSQDETRGNDNLKSRFTIHGGGEFEIQPRFSVLPYFVTFLQGPHVEVNLGTSMRFALGDSRYDKRAFQLGAWFRFGTQHESKLHGDALIITTKFDYQNLGFGLSYDINVSKLRSASKANNSLELSVIYNICGPEHRGVYCPRF